jgi:hypothetical protein
MTQSSGSAAPGVLQLTNVATTPTSASITLFDEKGHTAHSTISIGAAGTTSFSTAGLISGGHWLAASVVIAGGGVGVVEQIHGHRGSAVTPCASSSSTMWNFAGASTQKDQGYSISLVNPSSTPAVAGLSFVDDAGASAPQGTQGLVVRPRSLVVIPVDHFVAHGSNLASMVQVSQGHLVAFATADSPNPVGNPVTIGERALGSAWVMPRAVASQKTTISIDVANPTPVTQTVVIHVRLPSGWVAPWSQQISPYSVFSQVAAPATRVPATDTFAATVTSDGPGVVAFETATVASASSSGWGSAPLVDSASASARSWVVTNVPGFARSGASFANLGVTPVTIHAVKVTSSASVPISGLDGVTISPGSFLEISGTTLGDLNGSSAEITADGSLASAETLSGGAAPSVLTLLALPRS